MEKYEEQFNRVRRYYARFKEINDGIEPSQSIEAYSDDIHAFFLNCHHLKDWLKNDSAYTSHSNREVEEHVACSQALLICADICNGSKHLTLDRPPRSGQQAPKFAGKDIALTMTDVIGGRGEEVPTVISIRLRIDQSGRTLDAFELATRALQSWESFIQI